MQVKFLKPIKYKDLIFDTGKTYDAIDGKTMTLNPNDTYIIDQNGQIIIKENPNNYILIKYPNKPIEKNEYCYIHKKNENNIILTLPEITPNKRGQTYTKDYYLTETEKRKFDNMLHMTETEIYDRFGYKKDTIFTDTVIFTEHIQMDIQFILCGYDEKPYIQAVLFEDGCEVACSEVFDKQPEEYVLHYDSNTYISRLFVLV